MDHSMLFEHNILLEPLVELAGCHHHFLRRIEGCFLLHPSMFLPMPMLSLLCSLLFYNRFSLCLDFELPERARRFECLSRNLHLVGRLHQPLMFPFWKGDVIQGNLLCRCHWATWIGFQLGLQRRFLRTWQSDEELLFPLVFSCWGVCQSMVLLGMFFCGVLWEKRISEWWLDVWRIWIQLWWRCHCH